MSVSGGRCSHHLVPYMWASMTFLPLSLNYGGLICFALLPRSFVLVRSLREANVAIFARSLVGVDKVHKRLFQRVSLVTSMTLPLNYIFVLLLANVDVIPKQKQLSTV